ncbi:MAG: transposase [Pseudomonadota bacterium]
MSSYIRPKLSGVPVFFTVCLAHRGSDLLVREVALLRAVTEVTAAHPFEILAWVVLPDHLHAVWRMPVGDRAYGQRWGAIKSRFSRGVLRKHGWPKASVSINAQGEITSGRPGFSPARHEADLPHVRTGRNAGLKPGLRRGKRELGIWQRRFWGEGRLGNGPVDRFSPERAEPRRRSRLHPRRSRAGGVHSLLLGQPGEHGLTKRALDWPYSSIHRDIERGLVEPEWAGEVPEMEAGEP